LQGGVDGAFIVAMSDDELSWWERLGRVPAGSLKAQLLYISAFVAAATAFNVVWALITLSWAPVVAALLGWVFVGVYGLVRLALADRAAGQVGRILVPSGSSTPSVNQHSDIQTLVARGRYADAAAAYRQALSDDPQDLVACEQLGQLALRELKDYELALFAYREAERRATGERRRAGYALLAVGIYRDNLRDLGRTIVEMRRLLDRYPSLPNAESLRAELEELRARHFEVP
jgi:tetratricopeptide (TPR) repeat protein